MAPLVPACEEASCFFGREAHLWVCPGCAPLYGTCLSKENAELLEHVQEVWLYVGHLLLMPVNGQTVGLVVCGPLAPYASERTDCHM